MDAMRASSCYKCKTIRLSAVINADSVNRICRLAIHCYTTEKAFIPRGATIKAFRKNKSRVISKVTRGALSSFIVRAGQLFPAMLLIENNIQYAKSFRVTRNNNISVKKVLELPVSDYYIMTSSLRTVKQRNIFISTHINRSFLMTEFGFKESYSLA